MSYIQGSGSGGGPRIYPADSNDYLVWELQEAAGATTVVNTGTASSANLAPYGSAIAFDRGGPFGRAMINAEGTGACYGAVAANPSTSAITMSVWIKWYIGPGGWRTILAKGIAANSWAEPFCSVYLGVNGASGNRYTTFINVGGTRYYANADPTFDVPRVGDEWTHIGMTYDGTTLKFFRDGLYVAGTAISGVITHGSGYWMIGGSYTDSYHAEGVGALMRGVRVANIVRDAAWFKSVYSYGIGEAA